jgi:hypothetical protein
MHAELMMEHPVDSLQLQAGSGILSGDEHGAASAASHFLKDSEESGFAW